MMSSVAAGTAVAAAAAVTEAGGSTAGGGGGGGCPMDASIAWSSLMLVSRCAAAASSAAASEAQSRYEVSDSCETLASRPPETTLGVTLSPTAPCPPPEWGGLETCATTARREVAGAAASAGRTAPEAGARGALGLRARRGGGGMRG